MANAHNGDHCDPRYEIRFYDRSGNNILGPPKLASLNWGRKLDNISRAELKYVISADNCCEELGGLEPHAHSLGIFRSGKMVWYGWVEDIDYGRNDVTIPAYDALQWLKQRVVHNDLSWVATDLMTIFKDIWEDAMAPDPINVELMLFLTGVQESRELKAADLSYSWAAVGEMLDTGLDVTVIGQKVLAGIIPTTKPMQLRLRDVQGDVSVVKKGSKYASRVIVDASASVQGIYPPGPPASNGLYPLVETIIRDAKIQDVVSADNAAKARYEYSRRVPRLISTKDSLVLQPNLDMQINDLIPGIRTVIDTEGLCYSTKQEFRLGEVNVTVAGGEEKIAVSMQPVGARDSLNEAEAPL